MSLPAASRRRGRAAAVLIAGALAVGLSWAAAPPRTPPLYDGIGMPDEPYRYLDPPADARTTRRPMPATRANTVSRDGVNYFAFTDEVGPQAFLIIPSSELRLPPGAKTVELTAAPVEPVVEPTDGERVGNVYRFSGRAGGAPLVLAPNPQGLVVQLRAPQPITPIPTVELYLDGRWQPESTTRSGNDVYQGMLPALGDVALVRTASAVSTGSAASTGSGGFPTGLVVTVVALFAVIAAVLFGLRRQRRRAKTAPAPQAGAEPGPPLGADGRN